MRTAEKVANLSNSESHEIAKPSFLSIKDRDLADRLKVAKCD